VGERVDKGRNGKVFDAGAPWSRSVDDAAVLDEDKVGKVMKLIADRDTARAARDYSAADAIRDQLHAEFGVAVDDEVREWKVGPRVDKVYTYLYKSLYCGWECITHTQGGAAR
jgi:anaerobic glycerol-3-phosphate dehydrogenase